MSESAMILAALVIGIGIGCRWGEASWKIAVTVVDVIGCLLFGALLGAIVGVNLTAYLHLWTWSPEARLLSLVVGTVVYSIGFFMGDRHGTGMEQQKHPVQKGEEL